MTSKFILSILLISSFFIQGQELPNIVPPSPEASSVFKFSEIPVSPYTGLPNINIPLFEIESGGVTVPISISYHARGIQVSEIASRVGLGWALNCGGVFSKQVRGVDDSKQCISSNFFNDVNNRNLVNSNQIEGLSEDCDITRDQFSYSVNGMSGKLFLDYISPGWVPQHYSNLKITPPSATSDGRILDGKGNEYVFGKAINDWETILEKSIVISDGDYVPIPVVNDREPNTWHLSSIKTAKGPEIRFSYSSERSHYWRRDFDKYRPIGLYGNQSHVSKIESNQQRLDSITFSEGRLEFQYSTDTRQDLYNSRSLERIKLYDKHGAVVKQFIFKYGYTENESDQNTNFVLRDDDFADKRLFLTSLEVKGSGNDVIPDYIFRYDQTTLPSRHSNAVDIWGYFNGKPNGSFLTELDDETVSVTNSSAGMLLSIVRPEGGSTEFIYENNLGVNTFPESVGFKDPNPVTRFETGLSTVMISGQLDDETGLPIWNNGTYTKVFQVGAGVVHGQSTYRVHGDGVNRCKCMGNCPNGDGDPCMFTIKLLKYDPVHQNFIQHTNLLAGEGGLSLEPGKYKLVAQPDGSFTYPPSNEDFFYAVISWNESETVGDLSLDLIRCQEDTESFTLGSVLYAAGKRIKKILYKNDDGSIKKVRSYSYEGPWGFTSGYILGLRNFWQKKEIELQGGTATLYTEPYGAGRGSLFSTYQNNTIGYEYVTEYLGDENGTIGKTEYKYSMIFDIGKYYEFPYHPPTDNEWLRGKELQVSHYAVKNGIYEPVKTILNTYLFAGTTEFSGFPVCPNPFLKYSVVKPVAENFSNNGGHSRDNHSFSIPSVITPLSYDDGIPYKTYYATGGAMDIKSTRSIMYFNGEEGITEKKEFAYDYNSKNYNPVSVSHTTSDGATVVTNYQYPQHLSSGNALIAGMVSRNIVDVPLITTTSKGSQTSKVETVFKDWNTSNTSNDPALALYEPELVKTSKSSAATEVKVRFVKLDKDNGNVLQVKRENGMDITYLWGYGGNHPIAMIENATFSQVLSALGQTETGIKSLTAAPSNIRSVLPNAMVTTYTYKELVGVSSVTDPKGLTTSYTYDGFGRLSMVKDHNGNILSENQYYYQMPTNP